MAGLLAQYQDKQQQDTNKETQNVPVYMLPPEYNFDDVRGVLYVYHEPFQGDNETFLIDEDKGLGARFEVRDDRYLDLYLYYAHTLKTKLIASFINFEGSETECEIWEDIEWGISWLGLISEAKTFERLLGMAAVETDRISIEVG